jgi:hypothetical protein
MKQDSTLIVTAKPRKRNNIKFFTKERFTHKPELDYSGVEYHPTEELVTSLSRRKGMMSSKRRIREIAVSGVSISIYQSVVDFVVPLMLLIQTKKETPTKVFNVQLEQVE